MIEDRIDLEMMHQSLGNENMNATFWKEETDSNF